MHKKFEINRTKIKGSCQSGRKKVTHNSKSDLPLVFNKKNKRTIYNTHFEVERIVRRKLLRLPI